MRFLTILVSAALAKIISGGALDRRAPCSCPELDTAFYPLSSSSSGTRCYYPAVSRCRYSTTSGSLIGDSDGGLCRTTSTGSTCPSTDTAGYARGPGSGVHGTTLYCTYPRSTELTSTRYYCDYADSGTLTTDNNDGFCPTTAVCTSTSRTTSTTSRTTSTTSRTTTTTVRTTTTTLRATTTTLRTTTTTLRATTTTLRATTATLRTTTTTPRPSTLTPVTFIPTTSATSLPATSSSGLQQLYQCRPCGSSQCTFTGTYELSDAVYSFRVGTPISNCQAGSSSPITNAIGGSIMLQDSWGVSAGIEWHLGGLQVSAGGGWSRTEGQIFSQEITITIEPGQMGVLVANVQFRRMQGNMKIGSNQFFPMALNQPFSLVSFGQEIVPCGSQFTANVSSNATCPRSGASSLQRPASVVLVIVPLVVSSLVSSFIY